MSYFQILRGRARGRFGLTSRGFPLNWADLMTDNHYRSLVKSISWRVTGTLDTMVISFLITGKLKWALSIGAVELFTKMFLYYVHERIWNRIAFGRARPPQDYSI